MAYGTKYRVDETTRDKVLSYSLRIQETDHVGSSTDIEAISLNLAYGSGNPVITGGLMPSTLTAVVRDENKAIHGDFFGEGERHVRGQLYRDGSLIWTGYLVTDEIVQPLGDYDNAVTLRFVCALSYLTGADLTGDGSASIATVVADAISELALLTAIKIAIKWNPYRADSPVTRMAEVVKMDRDEAVNSDGSRISFGEVLETEIAERFMARVLQANGAWIVHQPELCGDASYVANRYDLTGAYQSVDDTISTLTVDEAAGVGILSGHVKKGVPSYKKSRTRYEHGPAGNFQGDEFESTQNSDFGNWQFDQPLAWKKGTGSRDAQRIQPGYDSGTALGFLRNATDYTGGAASAYATDHYYQDLGYTVPEREITIRLRAKGRYIYPPTLRGRTGGSRVPETRQRPMFYAIRIRNKRPSEAGGSYRWYNAETDQWVSRGENDPLKNEFKVTNQWTNLGGTTGGITTAPLPEGFEKTIRLYIYGGTDTIAAADGTFKTEYFVWDQVNLAYLVAAEETATAIETIVTNIGITASRENKGPTFRFGDGLGNGYARGFSIEDGGETLKTGDWKKGEYGALEDPSGHNLDRVWNERFLDRHRASLDILEAVLRLTGAADYWPHQALAYDGTQYICTGYDHDLLRRRIAFKGVQAKPSSALTIEETFAAITSDVDGDVNARTITTEDAISTQALGGPIAITAQTLTGVMTEIRVQALDEGIAEGRKLLVINPNGGYDIVRISKAATVGQQLLRIDEHNFAKAVPHPAGMYITLYDLYSLVLQTENAFGAYLKGGSIARIDGAQSGALTSLTITPLERDVSEGEDIIVYRRDGLSPLRFEVGAGGADQGARTIPIVNENLAVYEIPDESPVWESNVQFGAKLLVEPDAIEQSVERQRTGEGWTSLSSPLASGTLYNATTNPIPVAALTSKAKGGDVYTIVDKREGYTLKVTLANDHAAGEAELRVNDVTPTRTYAAGSKVRLSDETARGAIIVNADNISINTTNISDNSTSIASIDVRVSDNEASITSHAAIFTNNGLTSTTNITQRVTDNEASITSHASIFTANQLTSATDITQRVTDAEADISLRVERTVFTAAIKAGTIGKVSGAVNGTVTSLTLKSLEHDIKNDDRLVVVNPDTGSAYVFYSTGNVSATATSVTIGIDNGAGSGVSITVPDDAPIVFQEGFVRQSLAGVDVRVTDNEASITSHASIFTNNGLTVSTNITQRVDDNGTSITSINNTLSGNGITNTTDITSRVDTIGSRIVLKATSDVNGHYILASIDIETNTTQNASTIKLKADQIQIDGTTTFLDSNYNPTNKVPGGGAAADVNNNTTTISGGKITTGSVTATQIDVADLFAQNITVTGKLNAGGMEFGANINGTLNEGIALDANNYWYDTGAFRIGHATSSNYVHWNGTTLTVRGALNASDINAGTITGIAINNGSGTFSVDSAGNLTATSATITGAITATSGSLSNLDISGTLTILSTGKFTGDGITIDQFGLKLTTPAGAVSQIDRLLNEPIGLTWNGSKIWHTGNDSALAKLADNETVTGNWTLGGNYTQIANTGSLPAAPAAGHIRLYVAGEELYFIDSGGVRNKLNYSPA